MAMGPKRWSKIGSISRGWGCILEWFCRVGIYSQSQVKKSEALKMILNMRRTVYSSSQKQGTSSFGGAFVSQGRRAFCLQNGSAKRVFKGQSISERLFQNLDERNKGLTLRTSAIIYFRGNMSNKKDSMLTISLTEKASMWGASCETRGFALRTVLTKGIHFGGILL